ncbi:protein of unknown function (plasmid) [Cupriavidus taiwanensis]|nr:protein of unknown function [Cupriavidus taiwanensis]
MRASAPVPTSKTPFPHVAQRYENPLPLGNSPRSANAAQSGQGAGSSDLMGVLYARSGHHQGTFTHLIVIAVSEIA